MHREAQNKPQTEAKENKNKKLPKCPKCNSFETVKKGYRQTQHRGKIQRYLCRSCDKSFTIDEGFYRMRNHEAKITKAIDLYFSNLSSRKVRNNFKRHEDVKVSHVSVLDWCRKYVLKVQRFVDKLNPTLSGHCYADDTEIDRQGQKDHFWACVDWGTRYINAIHYSVISGYKEASVFLSKTKKNLPKYIQTDAAKFYPRAFRKSFYDNKLHGLKVEHKTVNFYKDKKHNVRIETVFMKIKDRVDDFRGLKALWSAPILLAGIVLQHNYIEEHTTTRKLPSELAELKLDTGMNRWLGLIRLASS
ncbi:MAG TPA: DDE-type integrase/transposase/recombinase [Candidatus Nanoarchaeia archaeon]|nr:DDE-type integrase/transposase/recombinase [Candidatus Nanoarchaeia archaeon]